MQADVLKHRIRIQEFFYDFDRLRKGYCGEGNFRTAIGTLKFLLSEEEMQELLNKYKLDNGLINYSSFCKNINEVFTENSNPEAVVENSKSKPVRLSLFVLAI
jgi:hypothetical protein